MSSSSTTLRAGVSEFGGALTDAAPCSWALSACDPGLPACPGSPACGPGLPGCALVAGAKSRAVPFKAVLLPDGQDGAQLNAIRDTAPAKREPRSNPFPFPLVTTAGALAHIVL